MKTYPVPKELMNEILGYLGNQPYAHVAGLVGQIGAIVEADNKGSGKPAGKKLPPSGGAKKPSKTKKKAKKKK